MKETWARFLFWGCFAVACASAGSVGAGVWKYGLERIGWVLPPWLPLFGLLGFLVALLGLAFFPQWSGFLLRRPKPQRTSQGTPPPSKPDPRPAEVEVSTAGARGEDRRAIASLREALQQLSRQTEQLRSLQQDVLEEVGALRRDFRRPRGEGQHEAGLQSPSAGRPATRETSASRGSEASHPAADSSRAVAPEGQLEPPALDNPFAEEESAAPTPSLDGDQLRNVWHTYRQDGDGNFNVRGFEIELQKAHVDARVLRADQMPVYGPVLGLVGDGQEDLVHLVPDFTKPPTAMAKWFADQGTGTRQRVKQLHRVAIVEQGTGELVQQGILS